MTNIYEISLLIDFYGQLITKRQLEIMDLHFNNDYSLSEISEQLDISRQGVFDNIKKGKVTLYDLEEKLGLVSKFKNRNTKADNIIKLIESLNNENIGQIIKEKLKVIKDEIIEIGKN